jgi:hypothetical protein
LPPTPAPTQPSGQVEVASSPFSDPSPFVLFGTLLFALAAAAGQVLRGDPTFFRRVVQGGLNGVRGGGQGAAGGNGLLKSPPTTSGAHHAGSAWTDSYDTSAHDGPVTYPGVTQAGFTQATTPSGYPGAPDIGMTTAGQPAGGLGGSGGGLHNISGGSSGGLDGFARGAPGGLDGSAFNSPDAGLGHDLVGDAVGHGGDVQADAMGQTQGSHSPTRPTDWGLHGPSPADGAPQAPSGGSLGGGSHGGEFARAAGGPGAELAHGANSSGLANGSLGGSHGLGNGGGTLGRGLTPGLDLASMPSTGVPDGGLQGGLGGSLGGDAGLGDALARSVAPPDPGALANAGSAGATGAEAVGNVGGPGPAWLAAGALARAGGLAFTDDDEADETREHPLAARTYQCPGCSRTIVFGYRFCGYCGEPLDKTLV